MMSCVSLNFTIEINNIKAVLKVFEKKMRKGN
jgi:hypothetical protein